MTGSICNRTLIENEASAVAANAGGVVQAAMVAHGKRNNGQATDGLLFHHLQSAPIQLRHRRCCGPRLKEIRDC